MSTQAVAPDRIAHAIAGIKPTRVAVAYVGTGWLRYLPNPEALEAIAVAPVLGSSPNGIRTLVKALSQNGASGWDRVFFLDQLHGKLYLGRAAAVWGSPNLSDNGLSGTGLRELATATDEPQLLTELHQFFETTIGLAKRAYPSESKKIAKLAWLSRQVVKKGFFLGTGPYMSKDELHEGDFETDPARLPPFHVVWWATSGESIFRGEAKQMEDLIDEDMEFTEKDLEVLKEGDWLLTWRRTPTGRPRQQPSLEWMPINKIFRRGYEVKRGNLLNTVAATLKSDDGHPADYRSEVPFRITPRIEEAFVAALKDPDLRARIGQPDRDPFDLKTADDALPKLLLRMAELLRDSQPAPSRREMVRTERSSLGEWQSAFDTLKAQGQRVNAPGRHVQLYPQRQRQLSAILYRPGPWVSNPPVHIKKDSPSFRAEVFEAIAPFLDSPREQPYQRGWAFYPVTSWKGFSDALGRSAQ